MTVPKKKKSLPKPNHHSVGTVDLEKFREGLSDVGRELFDIAMSIPEEDLMTADEILEEIAIRRGGIIKQVNAQENSDIRGRQHSD